MIVVELQFLFAWCTFGVPIGPWPGGLALFGSCSGGMKRSLFASTCASSAGDCATFLPAQLHQNEQPKLCSEVLIASIVCLHVPSMVDFADGVLDMSTHILRVR